jgi:membrane fusion protein, multidrug efflux system
MAKADGAINFEQPALASSGIWRLLMPYSLLHRSAALGLAAVVAGGAAAGPVSSQPAPSGPPAVGVIEPVRRPVADSYDFMGRIQAVDRVDLVARVSGFLEQQSFTEGADVKKGDLLYRLEQPPYQADLAAKQAAVAQAQAQLDNTTIQLERARDLMKGPAGMQARLDDASATQKSAAAQVRSAQAAERQSQINLGYTEIRSPIDGRISRTAVTAGNVVGPGSGVLATIVSQDPIYVTFPVPVRTALELRTRYAPKGGFNAVAIRLRLPDGRMYGHLGALNFADIAISKDTDSLTVRGTIPNPVLTSAEGGDGQLRELTDSEFVTVVLEAATPVEQLTLPRETVMSDQRGDFVYVVGATDKVERRAVKLGQSTAETALISEGVKDGERVVLEGVQRIQPGMQVAPAPADTKIRAADTLADRS